MKHGYTGQADKSELKDKFEWSLKRAFLEQISKKKIGMHAKIKSIFHKYKTFREIG